MLEDNNPTPKGKPSGHKDDCLCCVCRNIRGEFEHPESCQCCFCKAKRGDYSGDNHPLKQEQVRASLREKHKNHKPDCGCAVCRAKRGEYKGEHNAMKDPEVAKRSGAPQIGKKRPDISARMSGENSPSKRPECREKQRKFGGANSNWKGGYSYLPYPFEFNQPLKESIRERDGRFCQNCGKSEAEEGKAMGIHHIDYNKKNLLPCNLIALCTACNSKANTNRSGHRNRYSEMVCSWLGT